MRVFNFKDSEGKAITRVAEDDEHFRARFEQKYPGKPLPESSSYEFTDPSIERVQKAMTGSIGAPYSVAGRAVLEPFYESLDALLLLQAERAPATGIATIDENAGGERRPNNSLDLAPGEMGAALVETMDRTVSELGADAARSGGSPIFELK